MPEAATFTTPPICKHQFPSPKSNRLTGGWSVRATITGPTIRSTPITQVTQGETFLARLTLIVPHTLHYVMVEDYLPAGLEAIDTSLKTNQQVGLPERYEWDDYQMEGWGWWVFDHVELRDEKVALFASVLPAGSYDYVYLVRAAAPASIRSSPPLLGELLPDVYGRGWVMFTVEATGNQ